MGLVEISISIETAALFFGGHIKTRGVTYTFVPGNLHSLCAC